MSIGFGIVGTGMIAQFHAQAIAAIPDAVLVACFDMVGDRANAFADENSCQAYTDLDEMLANPDVQVVTICTPSGAHLDPAVAAAKADKHVLVEKPLEITLSRCDQIIQACEESGVKLGSILPSRFSPANLALKKAIEDGRFGTLTLGDTFVKWWRSQEYYDSGGWRGTWKLDGGGAFMNQAIHNVDLLYWFMGDVSQVCGMTATLAHERIEVEDVGSAVVRFKNGAIGNLEATTSAFPGLLKKTEIHGTKGSAVIEQDSILVWDFEESHPDDEKILVECGASSATSGGASDPKAISFIGHQKQFEDFIKAVQEDRTPQIDGYEGRKSVELILAIYQSSWEGQRIDLPLAGDPQRPD
ncbi:1,5-anhydro-D-fructose reductase [Thalassoglobus neptunius]|uniref:1,5-anhydro-D-fructose reductase n=1 Tax=Thalassoglobus neptunius TaxID=1938619 RepID=A0A5C5X7R9_9PLAN|nr:Gfo/Idh/MocA family oxidoreductase [Thalassoglobus neptunius]TWT58155.1 1,5-anhydro-D-fructose reductase [Thalassoglobus neptunius]